MLWEQLEAVIMAKPNYFHHAIRFTYPDGVTYIVDLFFIDGSQKEYVAYTQRTSAGLEVIKYKELI